MYVFMCAQMMRSLLWSHPLSTQHFHQDQQLNQELLHLWLINYRSSGMNLQEDKASTVVLCEVTIDSAFARLICCNLLVDIV